MAPRAKTEAEKKKNYTIALDKQVRDAAAEAFADMGLSFSAGIEIYLKVVAREGVIPFSLARSREARLGIERDIIDYAVVPFGDASQDE